MISTIVASLPLIVATTLIPSMFTISGRLCDEHNRTIASARILIFLDSNTEEEKFYTEKNYTQSNECISDERGYFKCIIVFPTFILSSESDVSAPNHVVVIPDDKAITTLTIIVYKEKYLAKRIALDGKKFKREGTINIGKIFIAKKP